MQGNPCYARLFADLTRMSPNPIKASGGQSRAPPVAGGARRKPSEQGSARKAPRADAARPLRTALRPPNLRGFFDSLSAGPGGLWPRVPRFCLAAAPRLRVAAPYCGRAWRKFAGAPYPSRCRRPPGPRGGGGVWPSPRAWPNQRAGRLGRPALCGRFAPPPPPPGPFRCPPPPGEEAPTVLTALRKAGYTLKFTLVSPWRSVPNS